jgi:uncharacterized protein YndB with AHSA1/START domain
MENKQQITLTRTFNAPREKVWRTWTEPEYFAQWFGVPPVAAPVSTIKMDVRPGGEWQATMISETDGTRIPFIGVYKEVIKPEKLVFILENVEDRTDPNVELATVILNEKDGKTEMIFSQSGHLPEKEYAVGLKQGYTSFFDRMEACVAKM